MTPPATTSLTLTIRDIHFEGQGHVLTINQVVQIAPTEIKTRAFIASSPYVGLRRFEERNKDVFFGRDQLVGQLLQRLQEHNLVLVAGASGSGKSSAVRAGLLPQLATRLPQGRFRALVMTPDRDPFASLRGALQGAGVAQDRLAKLDSRSADSIVETLLSERPAEDLWLLFVDQFEEIFRDEPAWCSTFLLGLTRLAQVSRGELSIVIAMRSEFFERFGPHPEFAKLIEPGLCLVVDLEASDLRAAIEQPAAQHGVVFEEGLVDQIIADVKGRPGALPLLQYTLDLLWSADNPASDRTLNAGSYHSIGGIEGALRMRADMLYRFADAQKQIERPPAQRESLRQLFLRLVDLTSLGKEAHAVSRRTLLSGFPREQDRQLISELVDEKLLVSNASAPDEKGPPSRYGTIEIAHEALLSAWPLLAGWIEQAREVLYIRNRLSADGRRFAEVRATEPARADEELWSGTRLAQALELRTRGDFTAVLGGLSADEETFLEASVHLRDKRAAERRRARQRLVGAGALVIVAIMGGLGFGWWMQRLRTREANAAAEQIHQQHMNTYVEQGRRLLFEKLNPGEALLWLHRAQERGSRHPGLPQLLDSALHAPGVESMILANHRAGIKSTVYSPDGRRVLTVSVDMAAQQWDAATGKFLGELRGLGVVSAAFSPNGQRIVTASADQTIRVWSVETGKSSKEFKGHAALIQKVAYSPDGQRIVTASADGTARVWDAETGDPLRNLTSHGGPVTSAAYSPDGRYIVTASMDRTARVWDATSEQPVHMLQGHSEGVVNATWSPDGRRIVTASYDGTARVWDAKQEKEIVVLRGHSGWVLGAWYSPDGRQIVTTSSDHTARLWTAEKGTLIAELKGHESAVSSAAFSPDGHRIVTASEDTKVRVWPAETGKLITELQGHGGAVSSAAYSPDGRYIVTASHDALARVWDADKGTLVRELPGHGVWVESAAYSPDGRRIVTASTNNKALIWDAEKGTLVRELEGHKETVNSASYSPDSRRIVTASDDRTALVWDAKQGETVFVLHHSASVKSAIYSSDGRHILTAASDEPAREWDAETGQMIAEIRGHGYGFNSAAYSRDGRRVITAGTNHAAQVWDAKTRDLLVELKGHGHAIMTALFSPDGRRIVTASYDGTARVWEADTGHLIAELRGHGRGIKSAVFSPDGRCIVTASLDQTARVWNVSETPPDASQVAHFIRCYVPFSFERKDSDIVVPVVPDATECQRSGPPLR